MHEEIPEKPGTDCEGLQIFVKLREGNELAQPRAFHIAAASFPAFSATGLSARVLVGSWHGVQSPIPEQENTTMLHLSVTGRAKSSYLLRATHLRLCCGAAAKSMAHR